MEYYNPITELEWAYGTWGGKILVEDKEQESHLIISSIGSGIIEFNLTTSKNDIKYQLEKNIFFYDKTNEIAKLFSFNSEGYIEFSDISIKSKNKQTEILSNFYSGYNLPPNIKITKKWRFFKNPKQLFCEVKMGKEEKTVVSAELRFLGR